MPELTQQYAQLGREALLDITTADTIGDPAGSIDEGDGVVTVYFAATMAGYPGWRWTVSIAHLDGQEPSVLETELTPGDTALLSPEWVPWADRLADLTAQDGADPESLIGGDDLDDDLDDEDDDDLDEDDDNDDDDDDDDLDDDDLLHHDDGDDIDGVDIDSVDLDSVDADSDDLDGDDSDATDSGVTLSAAPDVRVDEAGDSNAESDGAGPEQPLIAGVTTRRKKHQQNGEGDQP